MGWEWCFNTFMHFTLCCIRICNLLSFLKKTRCKRESILLSMNFKNEKLDKTRLRMFYSAYYNANLFVSFLPLPISELKKEGEKLCSSWKQRPSSCKLWTSKKHWFSQWFENVLAALLCFGCIHLYFFSKIVALKCLKEDWIDGVWKTKYSYVRTEALQTKVIISSLRCRNLLGSNPKNCLQLKSSGQQAW